MNWEEVHDAMWEAKLQGYVIHKIIHTNLIGSSPFAVYKKGHRLGGVFYQLESLAAAQQFALADYMQDLCLR
jgi:hypothetical protein